MEKRRPIKKKTILSNYNRTEERPKDDIAIANQEDNATIDQQQLQQQQKKFSNQPVEGIHTPCIINGTQVIALVDPGAMISFVDQDLALRNGWRIHPCKGSIKQAMSGSDLPRLGEVRDLELLNGNKRLMVTLEVGNLSGGEEVILGLNLFEPLGYQLRNIPILLPTVNSDST